MKGSQSRSANSGFFATINMVIAGCALFLLACSSPAQTGNDRRAPEVPANLQVPAGNKVEFHTYAAGVQIYRWNGSSWVFVAPEAILYDAETNIVGTHYAGPTWESNSGSTVKGTAIANVPSPNTNSIPLLLIKAVSSNGPGIFAPTTYIQRVNTVGGKAPEAAGTDLDQLARVPYTAEYYFYRAKH